MDGGGGSPGRGGGCFSKVDLRISTNWRSNMTSLGLCGVDLRLSPRATVGVGALASKSMSSLPTTPVIYPVADDDDGDDIDWPSLVETASKAVEGKGVKVEDFSLSGGDGP